MSSGDGAVSVTIVLLNVFGFALAGGGETVECPPCIVVSGPVCGHNPQLGHETFDDNCELEKKSCCQHTYWNVVHQGPCTPREILDKCKPDCSAVCGFDASKGFKSFINLCYMELENTYNKGDYKFKHGGYCTPEEEHKDCPDKCLPIYKPVCCYSPSRTSYMTFDNDCFFGLENKCFYGDYTPFHQKECTSSELAKNCKRVCPKTEEPLCAKSPTKGFKDYSNLCFFQLENDCPDFRGDYVVEHHGKCTDHERGQICSPEFCEKKPGHKVCGGSLIWGFYTFPDLCSLYAENKCHSKDYAEIHKGECKQEEKDALCKPGYCEKAPELPVCGVKGSTFKDFKNECFLHADSVCNKGGFTKAHDGKCTPPGGKCPKMCTADWNPVCGLSHIFGYKTFSNKCGLESENECKKGDFVFQHHGECTKPEIEKNCQKLCSREYKPVCASSPASGQKTFDNKCLFIYEVSCKGADYEYVGEGECKHPGGEHPSPDCDSYPCTKEYAPVCGYSVSKKKFQNFSNKCVFEKDNKCKYKGDFLLAHKGDCSPGEINKDCKRVCQKAEEPVCANSPKWGYVSFKNLCYLLYDITCYGEDFELVHKGKCSVPNGIPQGCPRRLCPRLYVPVCAFSYTKKVFRTFGSGCELDAENYCKYDGDYVFVHSGACKPDEEQNNCKRRCQGDGKTVCGVSPTKGKKEFKDLCSLILDISCYGGDYKLYHEGKCDNPGGPIIICNENCPKNYNPVCAFNPEKKDFKTFDNECLLKADNKCNKGGYILYHQGKCKEEEEKNDCKRRCTEEHKPVCGVSPTKGYKDFNNLCYLILDLTCHGGDYGLSHEGKCDTPPGPVKGCPGICPFIYSPICAFNPKKKEFKTFENECLWKTENKCKYDGGFIFFHNGKCEEKEEHNNCKRRCTEEHKPVCGVSPTKGYKDFINVCYFIFELTCYGGDYVLCHEGKCNSPPGPVKGCPGVCPALYSPVCAFNPEKKKFKTFDNDCWLKTDNKCKYDEGYIFVHSGKCEEKEEENDCKRPCSEEYKPVCGVSPTKGYKEFKNFCYFIYDLTCNGGDYALCHEGKCNTPPGPVKGCPGNCPKDFNPVCAYNPEKKDFKTFDNECLLKADNKCKYDGGYILYYYGKCKEEEEENDCKRRCPEEHKPVCGVSPTKGYKEFKNFCYFILDCTCNGGDYVLCHEEKCSTPGGPVKGCPGSCPEVDSPVCAFNPKKKDYKEFKNQCFMDLDNKCKYDGGYLFVHEGKCTEDEKEHNCNRQYSNVVEPVCAKSPTKGEHTFDNIYLFILEITCYKGDYVFSHKGKCKGEGEGCPALCYEAYIPVCGFSPKKKSFFTFTNICFLNVKNKCEGGDYFLVYEKECEDKEHENKCDRSCHGPKEPVCGVSPTKGSKTFDSSCDLAFAITCLHSDFEFAYKGHCKTPEGPTEDCPPTCTLEWNPVCGRSHSKGYKSFGNKCELVGENRCKHADFIIEHYGACTDDELKNKCNRDCPRIYNPVCGMNSHKVFKNFHNLCTLGVANKCDHADYSVVYNRKCTLKELGGVCNHDCELFYLGVCGLSPTKGHKTFPNPCFLDRENICTRSDYDTCHSGKCTPPELGGKCKNECIAVFNPICGKSKTKGFKTFPNFCVLDQENSCRFQDYDVKHKGECFPWETCKNCKFTPK